MCAASVRELKVPEQYTEACAIAYRFGYADELEGARSLLFCSESPVSLAYEAGRNTAMAANCISFDEPVKCADCHHCSEYLAEGFLIGRCSVSSESHLLFALRDCSAFVRKV